jgi:hypothetical protein
MKRLHQSRVIPRIKFGKDPRFVDQLAEIDFAAMSDTALCSRHHDQPIVAKKFDVSVFAEGIECEWHCAHGSPADFGKLIVAETEKWAKVVKFSGAKPD